MSDLRKYTNIAALVAIAFLAGSLITGGKGCDWKPTPVVDPVVVVKPPFATEKLAVLIVEESSDGDTPVWVRGTSAASLKVAIEKAGGEFRVLDDDSATDKLAPPWQEAMAAAKGKTLPWMVAADKTAGFSQPVTTQAAAMESLKALGVK